MKLIALQKILKPVATNNKLFKMYNRVSHKLFNSSKFHF